MLKLATRRSPTFLMPGPWIVVTADQEFRVEKRLIDTEFRVGEWHKDTEGKVVRIRERQNRFEVPFLCFSGGGLLLF